jgi:arylsulfatase
VAGTAFPAIEPIRPPWGAPNVLIVLLDDVGFGASSVFGVATHRRPFVPIMPVPITKND